MTSRRLAFADAAESLLGIPFRLHGRDPATGLDCVGLVAAALKQAGIACEPPRGYALRNLSVAHYFPLLASAGFAAAGEPSQAGDLVLVRPSPGQFHLLITARDAALIHAHAGLGRVTRTPAPLAWPQVQCWRLLQE